MLATNRIKRLVSQRLGDKIAFYRLTYNIVSLILFLFLYGLMPKPYLLIYDLPNPYDIIILVPQFLALAGIIWSFRYFSLMEFLGITQFIRWKNGIYNAAELDEKMTLKIEGPYKFSRHPLYFFIIAFLMFRPAMDLFDLTFLICTIAYFYAGSVYEEKKLLEVFGEHYNMYKAETPRIVPSLFRKLHKS